MSSDLICPHSSSSQYLNIVLLSSAYSSLRESHHSIGCFIAFSDLLNLLNRTIVQPRPSGSSVCGPWLHTVSQSIVFSRSICRVDNASTMDHCTLAHNHPTCGFNVKPSQRRQPPLFTAPGLYVAFIKIRNYKSLQKIPLPCVVKKTPHRINGILYSSISVCWTPLGPPVRPDQSRRGYLA